MYTRLACTILLAMALISCGDEAGTPVPAPAPAPADQASSEKEAARSDIGDVVADLLAGKDWPERLKSWSPEGFYSWEGKTHTPTEGLPEACRAYLAERMPPGNPGRACFLVLHALMTIGRCEAIPAFAARLDEIAPAEGDRPAASLVAREFCLAWAWQKTRNGEFEEAQKLFGSSASGAKGDVEREAKQGGLLARIIRRPDASIGAEDAAAFGTDWVTRMDRREIEFFRESSPMAACEASLRGRPASAETAAILLADMLFSLGGASRNRTHIWRQGLEFLKHRSLQGEFSGVRKALDARFLRALAWGKLLEGNPGEAKRAFEEMSGAESSGDQEAKLGLAVIAFMEDPSLQRVDESAGADWPHYWLGGRKFSFYRFPAREKRRESMESACSKTPRLRGYFTMLEALSLLGFNTSARHLLGLVMERHRFETDIEALCVEAGREVPRNVYAESQIWEQLD